MTAARPIPFSFWVTLAAAKGGYGWRMDGVPKATKKKPALGPNEIAVKVDISAPVSLFQRPALSISLNMPDAPQDFQLTEEMSAEMAGAIKDATGLSVRFSDGND